MKAIELREKTSAELDTELNELKSELFKLRFQHATNQLSNPMQLQRVKRDIARVKTVMREQELAQARENGGTKA
ncbi:MAG TPA: 50S ribosomal protein L29 [Clostridiaceae bacterium]|nr:50S ribosomal protein L29 [Clostridiaceae bacterium]